MSKFPAPLTFVTGKGGVGKSTLASHIAYKKAQAGEKVLLVELGEANFLGPMLKNESLNYKPIELQSNFFAARLDPINSLREYILHYVKIERIVDLFFENRAMKTFMEAAPGLNEISILGKVTSKFRGVGPEMKFDSIVVDSYATGHFLALLRAPIGLANTIKVGPLGVQTRQIIEILSNPNVVDYVIVSLPEELPVTETIELYNSLKKETGVESQVILNRLLNIPHRDQFASFRKSEKSLTLINYFEKIHNRQLGHLSRLITNCGKVLTCFLLLEELSGFELIEKLEVSSEY